MSEDVVFLRDQVERLTAVLTEYQRKYPPVTIPTEGTSLPWVSDRNLMAPLLAEYDASISALKNQVSDYTRSHADLHSQVNKLTAENARLTRELKECVQSQLEGLDSDALTPQLGDEQVLENLQAQLTAALTEKESAFEMWQTSQAEVERLEGHLSETHANPRLRGMEEQVVQIKAQYGKTVSDLNAEIRQLNDELIEKKTELQAAEIQVIDLRQALDDLRAKVKRSEAEKCVVEGTSQQSVHTATHLHKKVTQLESSLEEYELRLLTLQRSKDDLSQLLADATARCNDQERKSFEAVAQVRDSVQLVETAMLEKDAAIQHSKQLEDDLERATRALDKVIEEAGSRTREEVDRVRAQCNHNLTRLMDELETLESELSERESQVQRAVREKRAAETELDKVLKNQESLGSQQNVSLEELTRRACEAERSRDQAVVRLQAAEGEKRRLEVTLRNDNIHLVTKHNQLSDRMTELSHQYELTSQEKVSLVEKLDELERKVQRVQNERDGAVRDKTKEVLIMEQELRQRDTDHEMKLSALEDANRRTTTDLRQMLSSQQRMSAKWKEECNAITKKFEGKLTELRSELSREKKRCSELSRLLKESSGKTQETQNMLAEYTHNIRRMEQRVRDAEQRAAEASKLLPRSAGRDVVQNNRRLKQALERSLRDESLVAVPEPITVSDLRP